MAGDARDRAAHAAATLLAYLAMGSMMLFVAVGLRLLEWAL